MLAVAFYPAVAALLATPYLFIYDLAILAVPVAFLASTGLSYGFVPGERALLVLLVPLLLALAGAPVGVPLCVLLLLLVEHRRRAAAGAAQSGISGSR